MNKLQETIKRHGFSEVGRWCKVSRQAVYQWYSKGRLPYTESLHKNDSRKTHYVSIISAMSNISKEELLGEKT